MICFTQWSLFLSRSALVTCLASVLILNGCATSKSGHSEFYTWVDETGQLRTVQAPSAEDKKETAPENKTPQNAQAASAVNSNPSDSNQFNPDDFTPSDQVDAKLRDARLFAWQDESGKQNVTEVDQSEIQKNQTDLGVSIEARNAQQRGFSGDCCDQLASSQPYLWNDLAGRELRLEDYYQFQSVLDSDALVLDFGESQIDDIRIKTFIKGNKLALPDVLLLDDRFNIKQVLVTPFTHYVEESWASYGYMQGRIEKSQLEGVFYLVILPSQQIGVLELGENQTKITDLGSIMVQRDAPAP